MKPKPSTAFLGELVGTFILVFFGCGSVAAAVAMGAQIGLFQVAIVWGFGVCIAILLTGAKSGAHINPAITLAFATVRDFPWRRVPLYITAQFLGAFIAAAVLYSLFSGGIALFESSNGIVRGEPGSEASAMMFGEFYPNPGGAAFTTGALEHITTTQALLAEFVGTAMLAFAVFGFTDPKNSGIQAKHVPYAIGATLTALISLLAPISQAGFNPARDFAPRLFSSLAGWGSYPFEILGHGWLTVYILAPIAGAITGAYLQKILLSRK
ncbi:MIP/aquaporin family protein [Pelagicoccus mobilis]|uniref:MIP family channel protein n=1 Tax=Pelagicoccus mobilis TaxID=415221 RepID=A0A934S2X8_9BACT|nr:MIP family channel protein [Pelagicoccus mobilis]MBK1878073.1 MIP family channel protein [Pelagicoccus mobilis]